MDTFKVNKQEKDNVTDVGKIRLYELKLKIEKKRRFFFFGEILKKVNRFIKSIKDKQNNS